MAKKKSKKKTAQNESLVRVVGLMILLAASYLIYLDVTSTANNDLMWWVKAVVEAFFWFYGLYALLKGKADFFELI